MWSVGSWLEIGSGVSLVKLEHNVGSFFLNCGQIVVMPVPVRCPRGKQRRGRDQKAHFAAAHLSIVGRLRWESDLGCCDAGQ